MLDRSKLNANFSKQPKLVIIKEQNLSKKKGTMDWVIVYK
jgi:hypothetical protein